MKFVTRTLLTFLLAVAFFSCKKSNKEGAMIPKNAAVAIIVNGASISEKMPWEELKQNPLFTEVYNDTSLSAYVKSILDNPENSGIDVKNDMFIYLQKDSLGGYLVFKGNIKDEAKFRQFNSNMLKATATQTSGTNTISNEKMLAVWNKDHFAMVTDVPQMNELNKADNENWADTTSISPLPAPKTSTRDLKVLSPVLLSLKKDNTLAEDDRFSALMKNRGDMALWMNVEELNKGSLGMAAMPMMNMSKLYEGSLFTAAVNFQDGKIDVDATSYAGKEMTAIYKKYRGSDVNKDLLRKVSPENLAVIFAMNFKPEGLREFIKLAGMEGMINLGTAMAGFTFDDFIKANGGDILFAMKMPQDSSVKFSPALVFATSVGDKPSFEKLIAAGKKMGGTVMSAENFPYKSNDKYFAIGSDQNMINYFFSSDSKKDGAYMNELKDGSVVGYADLQLILNAVPKNRMDSLEMFMMDETLKMWDEIVVNGGEIENNGIKQHFEIRLMDKNTNSLKQLSRYIGVMGTSVKKKNESVIAYENEQVLIEPDTTLIP